MSHSEKAEFEKRYEEATARYDEWKKKNPNTNPLKDEVGRALAEERDRANNDMLDSWDQE